MNTDSTKKLLVWNCLNIIACLNYKLRKRIHFFPGRCRHLWSCIYFGFVLVIRWLVNKNSLLVFLQIKWEYQDHILNIWLDFIKILIFSILDFQIIKTKEIYTTDPKFYSLVTLDISPYTSLGLNTCSAVNCQ